MSDPVIKKWSIEKLVPYEFNSKKHNPDQVKRIAKSIKEFGWTSPIVVDKNGVIIAGHGRRLAAIELGYKEVPVWVRDDLDETQVRAARLADNRVAQGDMDIDMFRMELESLEYDMVGFFDEKELDFVTADLGEMNLDSFIVDVDSVVKQQQQETNDHIEECAVRRVPLIKAMGFKDISGADEIYVSRFMAKVVSEYNEEPSVAFVSFLKALTETEL